MAERSPVQAVPIGARIERAVPRDEGAWALPPATDRWPQDEGDPALAFADLLEGYVHERIPVVPGEDEEPLSVLALVRSGEDPLVELDDDDRLIPATPEGLEAVRAADALQASLPCEETTLIGLAEEIFAHAREEHVALRLGVVERLAKTLRAREMEPPAVLFHLAPWELVDEQVDRIQAMVRGDAAPNRAPILGHAMRTAAPGLAPALARIDAADALAEVDPQDVEVLADVLRRTPVDRIPSVCAARLSALVSELELDGNVTIVSVETPGDRLRAALERLGTNLSPDRVGARVVSLGLRGEGMPLREPAELVFDPAAEQLLGPAVQTRVLTESGRVRVWMTRLEGIAAGASVAVVALTEAGELMRGEATAVGSPARVAIELAWPDARPPREVAIAVEDAVAEGD